MSLTKKYWYENSEVCRIAAAAGYCEYLTSSKKSHPTSQAEF